MDAFKREFPDRFIQTGIAEANMIGLAAGLATGGKIPFYGNFCQFQHLEEYMIRSDNQ